MKTPRLPDECVGRILGIAGESDAKKLKAANFSEDVQAYATMTSNQLFDPLTDSLRGILQRLKSKTLEADGVPNSFGVIYDPDENSEKLAHVPDTLLSAWPRYHVNNGDEFGGDILVLTNEFAQAVAGGLDHALTTHEVHGRELVIFLDEVVPTHIRRLALIVSEDLGCHEDSNNGFDRHSRTLSLVVETGDSDGRRWQYCVKIEMEEEEDPTFKQFTIYIHRARGSLRALHTRDAGVIADVVRALLRTQEAPYLRLEYNQCNRDKGEGEVWGDVVQQAVFDKCSRFGVLPVKSEFSS